MNFWVRQKFKEKLFLDVIIILRHCFIDFFALIAAMLAHSWHNMVVGKLCSPAVSYAARSCSYAAAAPVVKAVAAAHCYFHMLPAPACLSRLFASPIVESIPQPLPVKVAAAPAHFYACCSCIILCSTLLFSAPAAPAISYAAAPAISYAAPAVSAVKVAAAARHFVCCCSAISYACLHLAIVSRVMAMVVLVTWSCVWAMAVHSFKFLSPDQTSSPSQKSTTYENIESSRG
ncbi:hypothetical protein CVS40_10845 [Lucilia cuprina]|nr:hypothetical protein CVS40_10845 [Lucilia cuprina]